MGGATAGAAEAPADRAVGGGAGKSWQVVVAPVEEGEPEPTEFPLRLGFVFAHTPRYPEEPPELRLYSAAGLQDADVAEARARVEAKTAELEGMPMIFELVMEARLWLREKAEGLGGGGGGGGAAWMDPEEKARREALQRALEEEQRVKAARAAGTPVTPESYATWMAGFLAETGEADGPKGAEAPAEKSDRLSGKLWFRQNGNNAGYVEEDLEDGEGPDGGDLAETDDLAELAEYLEAEGELDEEDLEGLEDLE